MKDLRMQHPRPQFIRDEWELLDGKWNFKFDDHDKGSSEGWHQTIVDPQTITVPYTYETQMSGVNDQSHHPIVWYEKEFEITEPEHYSLIFEGVDYICQVWLNGNLLGMHQGAYERFEFDLGSNLKEGINKITMRIKDSMDCEQPRGKQRWQKDNFGCWYVQTTGIWKSVWLEKHLTQHRIENVKITPDIDRDMVIFEPKMHSSYLDISSWNYSLEIEVSFDNNLVNSYRGTFTHQMVPIEIDTRVKEDASWGTKQWSPENPNLYDVTFKLRDAEGILLDEAISYFGMRKIHIKNGQVLLNNCQLYQRLILDQGYWPESGLTPPSLEALEKDIDKIFELGYNGLRKHQKIEDERFLYLCDKKGMLVWSEMPSTFNFNDIAIANFIDEW
ncbi:glycoside hydrolase family 2 protein, partial [Carnobacterium sp.]|uniref:glycoside hydrolase family 2 protein n=1 Tax=Carnobacterium sp. TaxID=48221 RepID=UPI0037C0BD75